MAHADYRERFSTLWLTPLFVKAQAREIHRLANNSLGYLSPGENLMGGRSKGGIPGGQNSQRTPALT
jgi:hypothetical protein